MKDQARRHPGTMNWKGVDLKHWRENRGLTQAQAAEALDVSLRAYTDRERSVSVISRECVLSCMYLGEKFGTLAELQKYGFIRDLKGT